MTTYLLHGFAQSGNCFKVAFYLNAAGLPWQATMVDFGANLTRDPHWRESVNPMGEAPVLEIDGERLSQSGAILTRLAEATGKFAPKGEAERFEALRWILFDNHKFTSNLAVYRWMRCFAPKTPDPAVMAFLKARAEASLAVGEKHFTEHAFAAAARPTIADFSMCGYLFFPADELGFDLAADYPAIHAWTERLKAIPGWKDPYEMLPSANMPRRVD
ncbi:glutathione S-transferase family protein [soil metagenome]